ncbi:hypothetical protein SAMN03159343_4109 [Klenkia marina]|uniref:Uncharacterized protein n=1 Tax=Klenkia marina TaxID=1960309 RepID=A0A1G4Z4C4_9ACTN|nr:hypothetical protein [Klenkia marina]SCX60510.1 hypothetical protein SAMN03159343_4109 [Klenkia marina]
MDDTTPTPDRPADASSPAPAEVEFFIRATHQLRRVHDSSVISTHCSGPCGVEAMANLSLAELIGPNPPGPLEYVNVELIDLATGKAEGCTRGLTPLSGDPTDVHSWP